MRLKDRVVIVTGAAMGLGKAFSVALAKEGARITAVDIADCTGTIKEIEASGGFVKTLRVDVSSPEETEKMAEETVKAFGKIDVLINNAGLIPLRKGFFDIDPDEWDRVMAVNVKGPWLCIKAVFPLYGVPGEGKDH